MSVFAVVILLAVVLIFVARRALKSSGGGGIGAFRRSPDGSPPFALLSDHEASDGPRHDGDATWDDDGSSSSGGADASDGE